MQDITDRPFTISPGTVQLGDRRVRALRTGQVVADSFAPLLVWEHPYYPQYFFLPHDLEAEFEPAGPGPRSKALGPSELFNVKIGERVIPRAARRFPQAPVEAMREAFTLAWSSFDTWMEEDEVVFTHARSPYVRIDALASSRHVRVSVRGEMVANSTRPVVLYETGLGPRVYLPRVDVRMDLFTPSPTQTHCPYKGTASYWSLTVGGAEIADALWGYEIPLPEAVKVAGLVCFAHEKDPAIEFFVDGAQIG